MLVVSPLAVVDVEGLGMVCIVQATSRWKQVPIHMCKMRGFGGSSSRMQYRLAGALYMYVDAVIVSVVPPLKKRSEKLPSLLYNLV